MLARKGTANNSDVSTTFRNYLIIGIMCVPGSLLGGVAVEMPLLGRKGAMSLATVLTGVFLLVSTTATSPQALLAWNCAYAVTSNMMYGVLYGEFRPHACNVQGAEW